MPHAYSQKWADYYKDCELQSDEELAGRILDFDYSKVNTEIARIVYEARQMKRQHEYVKEQIELQHQKNTELTERQGKWIKFSAILTAISTLTAAIAGACLTYMLTRPLPQQTPITDKQETTQFRSEPSNAASRPEKITDKAPSPPPLK